MVDAISELATNLAPFIEEMSCDIELPYLQKTLPQPLNYYTYLENDGYIESCMLVEYIDDKKVILPCFFHKQRELLYFSLYLKNIPLFNKYWLLKYPNALVIITDSIELAGNNQQYLLQERESNIVWVSWYGENQSVPDIDWTPLKNRRVYYLLKGHSGFDKKAVYETAFSVRERLYGIVKEFNYVSYFHETPTFDNKRGYEKRAPVIISYQQFFAYFEVKNTTHQNHCGILPLNQYFSSNQDKAQTDQCRKLFSPLIYEKTITFLYGNRRDGKSWLSMGIAMALSQGKQLFEGWKAETPKGVLYIHEDSKDSDLHEKYEILRNTYNHPGPCTGNTPPSLGNLPWQVQRSGNLVICTVPESSLDITSISCTSSVYSQLSVVANRSGHFGGMSLIIFDGISSLAKLSDNNESAMAANIFLKELQRLGYAILIIPPSTHITTSYQIANIAKRLPVDSIIRVKKEKTLDASKIGISIHIEKGFKLKDGDPQNLRIEFSPNAENPKWEINRSKRPVTEEIALIKNFMNMRKRVTEDEMAKQLGVSKAMVKKRKQQIRGKRPISKKDRPPATKGKRLSSAAVVSPEPPAPA